MRPLTHSVLKPDNIPLHTTACTITLYNTHSKHGVQNPFQNPTSSGPSIVPFAPHADTTLTSLTRSPHSAAAIPRPTPASPCCVTTCVKRECPAAAPAFPYDNPARGALLLAPAYTQRQCRQFCARFLRCWWHGRLFHLLLLLHHHLLPIRTALGNNRRSVLGWRESRPSVLG